MRVSARSLAGLVFWLAALIAAVGTAASGAAAQSVSFPMVPRSHDECRFAREAANLQLKHLSDAIRAVHDRWEATGRLLGYPHDEWNRLNRMYNQLAGEINREHNECNVRASAYQRSQREAKDRERRERERMEADRRRFEVSPSEPGYAQMQQALGRTQAAVGRIPATAGQAVLGGVVQGRLDAYTQHGIGNLFGNLTSRGPASPMLKGTLAAMEILNVLQGDGGPGASLFGSTGGKTLMLGTMALGEAAGWNPLQKVLVGGGLAILLQIHSEAQRDLQDAFRAFDSPGRQQADALYRQRVDALEMRDRRLWGDATPSADVGDGLAAELQRMTAVLGDMQQERQAASTQAMADARAARLAREAAQREAAARERAAREQAARQQAARDQAARESASRQAADREREWQRQQAEWDRAERARQQAERDAMMRAVMDATRTIVQSRSRSYAPSGASNREERRYTNPDLNRCPGCGVR